MPIALQPDDLITSTSAPARVTLSSWILVVAGSIILTAFFFIKSGVSADVARFLDNLHWSTAYLAAAWLAWIGVNNSEPEDLHTRRWFAWGLTSNAIGLLIWDVQVAIGWNPFPAPADLFFCLLGPCSAIGLWLCLKSHARSSEQKSAALDAGALAIVIISLVLTIYLPKSGHLPLLDTIALCAYPVFLLGAVCTGFIMVLTLRLRPRLRWSLFMGALVGTAAVWMHWNGLQLSHKLADGTWFNLIFSIVTLAMGAGAMRWSVHECKDAALDRAYETFLRVLPLLLVMLAVASVVLAKVLHNVSIGVQVSVNLGAVAVVLLAVARQSLLITERDRLIMIEQEMRESEGRYKTLFESAQDGIFIQCDMKILDCNQRALQMLRCTRDQIIGRSPGEMSPEFQPNGLSSKETAIARTDEARQGKSQFFEWRMKRMDGTEFDSEVSLNRIEYEGRIIIQAIVRDISQRKLAEEALRTSEAQFSTSFNSASIGMAIVDLNGRWVKVNRALCEMLGYTEAEMMDKSFQELTHPDDLKADLKNRDESLAGKIDCFHMEKRYLHKNGAVITAFLSASLVRDSHGNPLLYTGQIQDITERKKLEEQFRQSQKMEAVGQLAGGVAHDFNNILTVIQGYATLLQNQAISPLEALREISISVDRAASLTRQLLTFSRKQVMQPRELDINSVVEDMMKMLRRTLGEDITLLVDRAPDLPLVLADQSMMEQILLNLSVNARDAMPDGGRLHIRTSSTIIQEHEAQQHADARMGLAVCLRVSDTGCGIPYENQDRIFEPFFTTKEVNKGTGLGLATVHGIVRQHGGLIRLRSEPGKGTDFEILLPACRAPKKEIQEKSVEPRATGGTETILLVDDEAALRLVSKLTLQHFGYNVLEADSGRHAIDMMEKHPRRIDLLLTDMVMPDGMTGRQLAEHMVAERPDLRVLITSGYSVDLLSRNLAIPDDVSFLPKPFSPQKLARAVRECLST
jgi:two-component system, cell cycle sensor histidine kinase and response regulator CckA